MQPEHTEVFRLFQSEYFFSKQLNICFFFWKKHLQNNPCVVQYAVCVCTQNRTRSRLNANGRL